MNNVIINPSDNFWDKYPEEIKASRAKAFYNVFDGKPNNLQESVMKKQIKYVCKYKKNVDIYMQVSRTDDFTNQDFKEIIVIAIREISKKIDFDNQSQMEKKFLDFVILMGERTIFHKKYFEVFYTKWGIFIVNYGFSKSFFNKCSVAEKELCEKMAKIEKDKELDIQIKTQVEFEE